jgi:hemerythrin-like domain-containing protein
VGDVQSYLQVHHTTEDDMLWPPTRKALADDSQGGGVAHALEAEHSAIDPPLATIDAALADRDSGPQHLGELTDPLATALRAHLDHEEAEGLALIDATVTVEQWQAYGSNLGHHLGRKDRGLRSRPSAPARSDAPGPGRR